MKAETPRVKIQELRLEGFRAFENTRLSLDDLTVLVGRNGAGKSTIIDAFEFLREALTDSLENALERRDGIRALVHKGLPARKNLSIAIKLRTLGNAPNFRNLDKRHPKDDLFWNAATDVDFFYGFRLGLRSGGMGFAVEYEKVSVSINGFFMRGLDATAKAWLELPHRQSEPFYGVLLEALRDSLRAYRLSPAAIRAEPPIGTASLLNRDGSNVGDVLKHVEKNKDDLAWITRHLGAITPGIVGVKSGTAAGRRIVQFFQSSGGKTTTRFEIGDMSDGTLRCLAILLALRQRPAPAIVCIDEIEDSVHPAALAVLLDAVAASTERCQVLLTSHSPEALSHPAVTAGRVRVVEWHDGKSDIFRLSPGAEEMSRPPRSVGRLLRTNSLFTAERPECIDGDFFEGA